MHCSRVTSQVRLLTASLLLGGIYVVRQLVELANKIKEKKEQDLKRSFLFNDLINDKCYYDPASYDVRKFNTDTTEVDKLYFQRWYRKISRSTEDWQDKIQIVLLPPKAVAVYYRFLFFLLLQFVNKLSVKRKFVNALQQGHRTGEIVKATAERRLYVMKKRNFREDIFDVIKGSFGSLIWDVLKNIAS